jgi:hypothetical protein
MAEEDIKEQLNKHINSKLFRRFLERQNEGSGNFNSKSARFEESPIRDYEREERRRDEVKGLGKSRSSLGFAASRNHSPGFSQQYVNGNNPFVYSEERTELLDNEAYASRKSYRDQDWLYRQSYNNQTVQMYEEVQKQLKNELISVKEKYENILQNKNAEIKKYARLSKELNNQIGEMSEKIAGFEENDRKITALRTEKESLEKKVYGLENECENLRKQLEFAKSSTNGFKGQIDERDRSARSHIQHLERELRILKDRQEQAENWGYREKERAENLERKLQKLKDNNNELRNELSRLEERNIRLEREVKDSSLRINKENNTQLRETEYLRRRIDELSQEVMGRRTGDYDLGVYERGMESNYRKSEENEGMEEKRQGMHQPQGRKTEPNSYQMREILSPKGRSAGDLKQLEAKLMNLQLDKRRLEDELAKIPVQGKRMAQIKRQQEAELELEIVNTNISTLKLKLRQANAY